MEPVVPGDLVPYSVDNREVVSLQRLQLTLPSFRRALEARRPPNRSRVDKLGFDIHEGVRGTVWRIADAWASGRFTSDTHPKVSVAFFDLTNTTSITDATSKYGEAVGDHLIQAFGDTIEAMLPTYDRGLPFAVIRALQPYHTGGDEFTVLMPHAESRDFFGFLRSTQESVIREFLLRAADYLRVTFPGEVSTVVARSNLAVKCGVAQMPLARLACVEEQDVRPEVGLDPTLRKDAMTRVMHGLHQLVLDADAACRLGTEHPFAQRSGAELNRFEFALIGSLAAARSETAAPRTGASSSSLGQA